MAKTNAQVALEAAAKVQAAFDSSYSKSPDAVLGTAEKFYNWLEGKS